MALQRVLKRKLCDRFCSIYKEKNFSFTLKSVKIENTEVISCLISNLSFFSLFSQFHQKLYLNHYEFLFLFPFLLLDLFERKKKIIFF
jgi:hypothetical protein